MDLWDKALTPPREQIPIESFELYVPSFLEYTNARKVAEVGPRPLHKRHKILVWRSSLDVALRATT